MEIEACVILDNEGQKVFAKYFPTTTAQKSLLTNPEKQKKIETLLFQKTEKYLQNSNNAQTSSLHILHVVDPEEISHNGEKLGRFAAFQVEGDLFFYVVASDQENELVLGEVLLAITDTLDLIFDEKNKIGKRTILDNFDMFLLVIDEIIDDGMILELDPSLILKKVKSVDAPSAAKNIGQKLGMNATEEDAMSKLMKTAKSGLASLFSL